MRVELGVRPVGPGLTPTFCTLPTLTTGSRIWRSMSRWSAASGAKFRGKMRGSYLLDSSS